MAKELGQCEQGTKPGLWRQAFGMWERFRQCHQAFHRAVSAYTHWPFREASVSLAGHSPEENRYLAGFPTWEDFSTECFPTEYTRCRMAGFHLGSRRNLATVRQFYGGLPLYAGVGSRQYVSLAEGGGGGLLDIRR